MFENVDGRTDGRTTDAGVTGILIAHLGAFGSGELNIPENVQFIYGPFLHGPCKLILFEMSREATRKMDNI